MSNNAQLIAACLGTAASIGIILFFGALNLPLMIKLNKMEIPRTQWEFDNSLVYKTFLMEFINTFAPVFYLAFFKVNLHLMQVKVLKYSLIKDKRQLHMMYIFS